MSFRTTCLLAAAVLTATPQAPTPLGAFESHGDIGTTPMAGSAVFDRASGEYRITGGGANMWGVEDAFHFVWKRVTGDVDISADVRFVGDGTDPHRKAVLVVRQDLTPGSAYADIAVHGDGLTSLQFRPKAGAPTQELRSAIKGPSKIRLVRRGSEFTVSAGDEPTGPQAVEMTGPVYVGLGVCSHNASVLETAVFSHVRVEEGASEASKSEGSKSRVPRQ